MKLSDQNIQVLLKLALLHFLPHFLRTNTKKHWFRTIGNQCCIILNLKKKLFVKHSFSLLPDSRPARQLLPPMKGYVPVYIREGDTPLEEINLDLAEAFHAIPSGRSAGRANLGRSDIPEDELNSIPDVKIEPAPVPDFSDDVAIKVPKEETKKIAEDKPQDIITSKANSKIIDSKTLEEPKEVSKNIDDLSIVDNDSPVELKKDDFSSKNIQKIPKPE